MTKLDHSDILGKSVSWLADSGEANQAKIEYHIRDGATAAVFRARQYLPGDRVVKIPFEAAPEKSNFVDEVFLVDLLHDDYRKNGDVVPLPLLKRTKFLDRDVIVSDFLNIEWQLIAQRENPVFLRTHYYTFTQQALKLFTVLHEHGFANLDIKDENFYWLPDNRLMVLDWNRCIQDQTDNEEKHTQFTTAVKNAYRTLCNLFYQFYTGKEIPNPLPSVVDTEWGTGSPRTLRRILIDINNPWGLNEQEIENRLAWQATVASLIDQKDIGGIFRRCDELHETSEIDLQERVERVQDAVESVRRSSDTLDLFADLSTQLQKQEDWIHEILSQPELKYKDAVDQIRVLLGKFDTNLALQTCQRHLSEMRRPNSYITRTVLWKMTRWQVICQTLVRISGMTEDTPLNVNNYQEIIPQLLWVLDREPLGDESQLQALGLGTEITCLYAGLKKAEEFKQQMLQAYNISQPQEKLSCLTRAQGQIKSLRGEIPDQLLEVLERFIPLWDRERLEAEVLRYQENQSSERKTKQLKSNILEILEEPGLSSLSDSIKLIDAADVELDYELGQSKLALHYAFQFNWHSALGILAQAAPDSFLLQVSNAITEKISAWLTEIQDKELYAPDINRLQEIHLHIPQIPLPDHLQQLIDFAATAKLDSEEDLTNCKKRQLEPWALGPDDTFLLVDNLKNILRLKKHKKELEAIRAEIGQGEKNLKNSLLSENEIEELKQAAKKYEVQRNNLQAMETQLRSIREILANQHPETTFDELSEQLQHQYDQVQQDLGVLRYQQKLVESLVNSSEIQTGSEKYLPFATEVSLLISMVIGYACQGKFSEAANLLGKLMKDRTKDLPEESLQLLEAIRNGNIPDRAPSNIVEYIVIISSWRDHLFKISKDSALQVAYTNWINHLSKNDPIESWKLCIQLLPEKGKPLYEHLSHNQAMIMYGKDWGPEARWLHLFEQRQISDLKNEIEDYKPSNGYERWQHSQWRHRLYLYDMAFKYIAAAKEKQGDRDLEIEPLLQMLIPADIWAAASGSGK